MNLFSVIYCKLLLMSFCCLYKKKKITIRCAKAPACVGCGFQGRVGPQKVLCTSLFCILQEADFNIVTVRSHGSAVTNHAKGIHAISMSFL